MSNRMFSVTPDGKECLVSLDSAQRGLLEQMGLHVRRLLTEGDESGETRSLFPPAYGEDWARQVEFDRLMKDDLSRSHVSALDALLYMVETDRVSADQLENFMRAINQIRLVMAKWLDVSNETTDEDFPTTDPKHDTWRIYRYFAYMQSEALDALTELEDLPA